MDKYICARPVHPGEVIKEEVEYRRLAPRELAKQMGISYRTLNDILNERRSLSAADAMLFEAAMDIPADALMRMQLDYNMQVTSQDKSFVARLAGVRQMAAAAAL